MDGWMDGCIHVHNKNKYCIVCMYTRMCTFVCCGVLTCSVAELALVVYLRCHDFVVIVLCYNYVLNYLDVIMSWSCLIRGQSGCRAIGLKIYRARNRFRHVLFLVAEFISPKKCTLLVL